MGGIGDCAQRATASDDESDDATSSSSSSIISPAIQVIDLATMRVGTPTLSGPSAFATRRYLHSATLYRDHILVIGGWKDL